MSLSVPRAETDPYRELLERGNPKLNVSCAIFIGTPPNQNMKPAIQRQSGVLQPTGGTSLQLIKYPFRVSAKYVPPLLSSLSITYYQLALLSITIIITETGMIHGS